MTISWQLFECKSNTRWSLTELFSPLATKRTELLGWRNMNRRTHHSQAGIGSLIIDPSCFDWTLFLEGWVLLIKLQVGRLVKEWKANVYNLRYFIYIYTVYSVYIYIYACMYILSHISIPPQTDIDNTEAWKTAWRAEWAKVSRGVLRWFAHTRTVVCW